MQLRIFHKNFYHPRIQELEEDYLFLEGIRPFNPFRIPQNFLFINYIGLMFNIAFVTRLPAMAIYMIGGQIAFFLLFLFIRAVLATFLSNSLEISLTEISLNRYFGKVLIGKTSFDLDEVNKIEIKADKLTFLHHNGEIKVQNCPKETQNIISECYQNVLEIYQQAESKS